MKLRVKILALSMALLAILCAALFVSLRLQREVHADIASGKDYHLPLAALLAEAESAAPGYQLTLAKAVGDASARNLDALDKQAANVMGHLGTQLDSAQSLLARAVADPRNEVNDRVTLARIEGTMRVVRREAFALEASGQHLLAALRQGDGVAVAAQFREFARAERAVDLEIESARRDIARIAEEALGEVVGHEDEALRISMLLFAAAPVGELPSASAVLHERWAEALDRYRARDWRAARAALAGCLEVAPEDGPARLFSERIARFDVAAPPANWDGVSRLEKV